jgi:hypothetical protein
MVISPNLLDADFNLTFFKFEFSPNLPDVTNMYRLDKEEKHTVTNKSIKFYELLNGPESPSKARNIPTTVQLSKKKSSGML